MKNSSRILSTSIAALLTGATILLGAAALLALLRTASDGAEITFAAPQDIQSSADTLNSGVGLFRHVWASPTTLSGVDLSSLSAGVVTAPGLRIEGMDNLKAGAGLWSPDSTLATITLSELAPGHAYAVQLWADDAPQGPGRRLTVSSAQGNSQVLKFSATDTLGVYGQYVIGNFVADAKSQALTILGTSPGWHERRTQLNVLQFRDVTGVWSGAINGVWDTSTPNFSGGQTSVQVAAAVGRVLFEDRDGLGLVANRNVLIQPKGISIPEIEMKASGYTISAGGGVGLTGSMTLRVSAGAAAATAIMAGAHTYTGPTILNSGTLVVDTLADGGVASGLGQATSAPGNLVFAGGALRYSGPSAGSNRSFEIRGTTNATATFDVEKAETELTLRGDAFFSPTAVKTNFTKDGAGTLTLTGMVPGKPGAAGVDLVTIKNGTLRLGHGGVFGTNSTLLVVNAGRLDLNGYDATFKDIGGGGTITDLSAAPGTSTLRISETNGGIGALITDGPNRQVRLVFGDNRSSDYWQLNPLNTFSGGMVLAPTLSGAPHELFFKAGIVGAPGNIVSGPYGRGPIVIGLDPRDRVGVLIRDEIKNDLVIQSNRGTVSPGINISGDVISGAILAKVDLVVSSPGWSYPGTLSGPISSGETPTGLVIADSGYSIGGAVTLKNVTAVPNSYTGNTTIKSAGTLTLGAAEQIPHGVGKGDMIIDGRFLMGGFSETINGLSGSGVIDGVSGSPRLSVRLNGGEASYSEFSGKIQNTAGSLALVKSDGGTLVLSGLATHAGPTDIYVGMLAINGELLNSPISVKRSGTLAGRGRVQSAVEVIVGGVVEAGLLGTGTLTLSSLNFLGDANLKIGTLANYATEPGLKIEQLDLDGQQATVRVDSLAGVTLGTTYKVLSHTGPVLGATADSFQLAPLPARGVGELVIGPDEIGLKILSTSSIRWTGGSTGEWDTETQNWKINDGPTSTSFIDDADPKTGAGADAVRFGGDFGSSSVTVQIKAAHVHPSEVVFSGATNYTLEGARGIWGPTGLTKSGTGQVTLNTPNGYAGITTIGQGVVRVGHSTALGSASGATTVAAGAALEVLGGISMAEPLVLTGTGISGLGALRNVSANNSLAGPVTIQDAATSIQADAGTMTFTDAANIISAGLALTVGGPGNIVMNGSVNLGTGTLTKTGVGTLIISGRELTTGGVTIASGTLQVGNGGFMTTTLGPVANDGHLLLFLDRAHRLPDLKDQPIQDRTSVISGSGHVTYQRDAEPQGEAGKFLLNDANTYTGGTTVAAQLSVTNPLAFGTGRVEILDGAEVTLGAGTMANDFTVQGRGVAALGSQSAAIIFSGATVQGGITLLGDTRLGGFGKITGPISGAFALEAAGGFTLTADNNFKTLTIVKGATVFLGDGGAGGTLGPATQIFNEGTLTVNRSDSAELSNAIHGPGNFSKLGTGMLTLSGSSDFTGSTTVETGTLNLTGSLTGSPVTVRPYATFIATGRLAKKLFVHAEGTLGAGLGIGELHADGGLTLRAGSRLQFDLNGADPTPGVNDRIYVTGDLSLERMLDFGTVLNVAETVPGSFLAAAPGDTWALFTYSGALIQQGLDLGTMPELSGDLQFAVSYDTPHEVNLTVVPEPGAAALMLGGLGLLFLCRRRTAVRRSSNAERSPLTPSATISNEPNATCSP